MARLTHAKLDAILANIAYHGDMGIAVRPATYEALLCDATGNHREFRADENMRYVDAPALEALVNIARAKLKAEEAQPRQRFEAQDWTRLDPAFLPLGGSDPRDSFHVIVKASQERSMTPEELARGPSYALGGTIISVEWPVAMILATVENAGRLAERIAHLMTEDAKGV